MHSLQLPSTFKKYFSLRSLSYWLFQLPPHPVHVLLLPVSKILELELQWNTLLCRHRGWGCFQELKGRM